MDPVYGLQATDFDGLPQAVGLCIMAVGVVVVTVAALVEHWTKRSNIVTRALDRWHR